MAKRGRKPKDGRIIASTPGELKVFAREYVKSKTGSKPPLLCDFECVHGTFANYLARVHAKKNWEEAVSFAKDTINAAFAVWSFCHASVARISTLKLNHLAEFAPVKQEYKVDQTTTLDWSKIREMADQKEDVDG